MAMAGEVDRISSLPSEILERILFFTGMKQAVQLSILSSRWKDLWKSMPDLYFNARDFPPNGDQNQQLFVLACKVLTLRSGRVRELRIEMCNNGIPATSSRTSNKGKFSFPGEYTNIINFGMLRSLSIWRICDPYGAFELPSDASPLLEKLSMGFCSFNAIDISFSRLKVLTLHDCIVLGGRFRVATPSLESFDYRQRFPSVCKLENLPSLRHASIKIYCDDGSGDAFLVVLRAIQSATTINLSWTTLEAHYKLKGSFNCLPTFYNAKHLIFLASCQSKMILTKDLFQKWPNIETLTIRESNEL